MVINMADKICVDLPNWFKMEDADVLAGALDSYQEFGRENLGIDVGMKTVLFQKNVDDTITVCGEKEDMREFRLFVKNFNHKLDGVRKAFINKFG